MQAGATEDDDASFEMRSAAVPRNAAESFRPRGEILVPLNDGSVPRGGRSGRLGGCTMLVLRETA
jgi:hypothetical protein